MVFQLNANIPLAARGYDYGRSQQNALRGLQMQAAEREVDEQNALAQVLRDNGEALTSDDPSVRGTAAAQIARTGMRGYQIAAPVLEAARNEREFNAYRAQRGGGGGGGGAAAPAGAIPAAMPGAGGVRTGAAIAVPAELDDADILARTILGEAANQGEVGQRAVAAVVRNRMQQTGRGVRDVVLAPSQFEPWGARRDELLRIPPSDPRYIAARRIAEQALAAGEFEDPTGGATHFLNPDLQRQLGRQQPSWAPEGQGRRIGAHVFYTPGGGVRVGQAGAALAGGEAIPASAQGGDGQRMPGMPTPAQFAELVDLAGSPNPRIARWAQAQVQTWAPFMRREDPERFVETARNIGGRQVVGQINQRTGQFTPYPGQAGGSDGITPAQARSEVLQLGPRVAAGEIQPGTPEYDRYEMAYRLATQDRFEWVDDPNNPGNMRLMRVPGIQLNPGRFPPPADGVYGSGGAATAGQAAAAPAAPPAPAGAAPAAPAGAPAPAAAPAADATSANPTPITRQAPNAQPTGEENLSAGYARRMVEAEALMERVARNGYQPGNIRDGAATAITTAERAGPVSRFVGNSLMTNSGQQYRQAQEDWVRAKLRRESGAVIGRDEMAAEIMVYFPQPGDTPETIQQKAQSRRVAMDAMRQAAGRAAATVPQAGAGQPRRVSTPAEAAALPPGTEYVTPDGSRYIR
jgi:hypothetical protein